RHDARQDRHTHAGGARSAHEGEIRVCVEEELRRQECGAGADLLPRPPYVIVERRRFEMPFRIRGRADAEVELAAHEADELGRVREPALRLREVVLAFGRIAAQGHQVLDAIGAQPVTDPGDLIGVVADAGEVRRDLDPQAMLQLGDELDRPLARAAARAVGHGDEIGAQRLKLVDGLEQVARGLVCPGREELEREHRTTELERLRHAHPSTVLEPLSLKKRMALALLTPMVHSRSGMKGLVALVSVFALVVSLGPLARVASAETYAASYAVLSPPTMLSGAFATVGLRVTNTGTSTWNATGSQPVSASYHWLRCYGSGLSWDGERTGFGADVPPGASRLVNVRVYGAPGSPGGYRLQIALVKEGVAWFPPSGSVSVAVVTRSTAALQASLSASPPPTLLAGGSANVDVAVTNVGASTWPATGAQPVNLSYHWYDANGKVVVWDGARTSLGSDLAASAPARTLQATVRAPTTPGTYFLVFEMVREGLGWFGAQAALATFVGDPAHSATYVVAPSASGFIGEQRAFDVTVRNFGGSSWPSTGANAVHLSYHWRDAQGALVVWDGMRTSLVGDVGPGASRTIALSVQTPKCAGAYTLAVDL